MLAAGEGSLFKCLQTTFNKPWQYAQYTRATHAVSRAVLPDHVTQRLPGQFCAKALLLSDVPTHEALYVAVNDGAARPGACAVALARHGAGRLMYVGDVNGQESSLRILRGVLQHALSGGEQ